MCIFGIYACDEFIPSLQTSNRLWKLQAGLYWVNLAQKQVIQEYHVDATYVTCVSHHMKRY